MLRHSQTKGHKKISRLLFLGPILLAVAVLIAFLWTILLSTRLSKCLNPEELNNLMPELRLEWTNLPPLSTLAKKMQIHQHNCSLPLGDFSYRNKYGLGSDLHIWGQGLCNAMERGVRLRTAFPWIFFDQHLCDEKFHLSPMKCYFPSSELNCKADLGLVQQHRRHTDSEIFQAISQPNGRIGYNCTSLMGSDLATNETARSYLRRASIEWLFSSLSPLVIQEARRQARHAFATYFKKNGYQASAMIPSNLITVHIRWGDKGREMKLVNAKSYVDAVYQILTMRGQTDDVHIFLATEDPAAVKAFQEEAPRDWNIYLDQYFVEMLPHRIDAYNGSPKTSKKLQGHTGLVALASLLVAMEGNDFVLTTASNWSRLLDELRTSVLDPRCNGCTSMIDLRKSVNEW